MSGARPAMAARKRSWASEPRRLALRMLNAKLRRRAKTPGLLRVPPSSSDQFEQLLFREAPGGVRTLQQVGRQCALGAV